MRSLEGCGARPMHISGRVMNGFVWVAPDACDGRALKRWIELAENYVGKLPVKERK